MQQTTLIDGGETVGNGYAVTDASRTMGATGTQQPVGVQFGGAAGEPVIKAGSFELGFEDVFLILIALQTLGVFVDLIGEVRR